MINFSKKTVLFTSLWYLCSSLNLNAISHVETEHDILFEVKGAVFKPTNDTFREIYNNCPEFGIEVTGNMFDRLYAFASIDLLRKEGETLTLSSSTQVSIINLAFGVKYFVPFSYGDFYIGLGIEPTYLCTIDQTPNTLKTTQWSCGGIAKSGIIVNLPRSLFFDFFFDYSFVKSDSYSGLPVQLNSSHLDGCLFGFGFGYRFN